MIGEATEEKNVGYRGRDEATSGSRRGRTPARRGTARRAPAASTGRCPSLPDRKGKRRSTVRDSRPAAGSRDGGGGGDPDSTAGLSAFPGLRNRVERYPAAGGGSGQEPRARMTAKRGGGGGGRRRWRWGVVLTVGSYVGTKQNHLSSSLNGEAYSWFTLSSQ